MRYLAECNSMECKWKKKHTRSGRFISPFVASKWIACHFAIRFTNTPLIDTCTLHIPYKIECNKNVLMDSNQYARERYLCHHSNWRKVTPSSVSSTYSALSIVITITRYGIMFHSTRQLILAFHVRILGWKLIFFFLNSAVGNVINVFLHGFFPLHIHTN